MHTQHFQTIGSSGFWYDDLVLAIVDSLLLSISQLSFFLPRKTEKYTSEACPRFFSPTCLLGGGGNSKTAIHII